MVKRAEGKVDFSLGCMSILVLALVVWSQFVTGDWQVPFLSISWSHFQIWLRAVIWLCFVGNYVTYATISGRPFHYVWNHLVELIICVCWVPQSDLGKLDDYVALLSLTKVVPLDALQLCGTVAHAWRVVRFTAQRFSSHPIFVTGVATAVMVSASSALLVYVEPKTFPTFADASWYALTIITKAGISDAVPHTMPGRWISVFLIFAVWSVFVVFFGLVSELVRAQILKPDHITIADLQKNLTEHRAILEKLLKE
jgi:hypothetical protein